MLMQVVPQAITEGTLVPLSLLGAVIVAVFAGYKYLRDNFELLRRSISELREEVREVKREQSVVWTRNQMQIWALEFGRHHPELKIPSPFAVAKGEPGTDLIDRRVHSGE